MAYSDEDLRRALRNAHQAGNEDHARRIAAMIQSQQQAPLVTLPPQGQGVIGSQGAATGQPDIREMLDVRPGPTAAHAGGIISGLARQGASAAWETTKEAGGAVYDHVTDTANLNPLNVAKGAVGAQWSGAKGLARGAANVGTGFAQTFAGTPDAIMSLAEDVADAGAYSAAQRQALKERHGADRIIERDGQRFFARGNNPEGGAGNWGIANQEIIGPVPDGFDETFGMGPRNTAAANRAERARKLAEGEEVGLIQGSMARITAGTEAAQEWMQPEEDSFRGRGNWLTSDVSQALGAFLGFAGLRGAANLGARVLGRTGDQAGTQASALTATAMGHQDFQADAFESEANPETVAAAGWIGSLLGLGQIAPVEFAVRRAAQSLSRSPKGRAVWQRLKDATFTGISEGFLDSAYEVGKDISAVEFDYDPDRDPWENVVANYATAGTAGFLSSIIMGMVLRKTGPGGPGTNTGPGMSDAGIVAFAKEQIELLKGQLGTAEGSEAAKINDAIDLLQEVQDDPGAISELLNLRRKGDPDATDGPIDLGEQTESGAFDAGVLYDDMAGIDGMDTAIEPGAPGQPAEEGITNPEPGMTPIAPGAPSSFSGREHEGGVIEAMAQREQQPPDAPEPTQQPQPESAQQPEQQPEQAEGITETGTGIFRVPVDQIQVDPEQYQFRTRVNQQGVDSRLEGVKEWDDKRAGTVLLHRRADGSLYVADGHHRVDLAKRIGQGSINAHIVDEADGTGVEGARVEAAMINIADGKAEPLDVAKVFRNTEVPLEQVRERHNLPNNQVTRDGEALAKLGENVFGMVASGQLSDKDGAAIGANFADPAQQEAAAKAFQNAEPDNDYKRQALVDKIAASGFTKDAPKQQGLFGDDEAQISLLKHSLDIQDRLRKELNTDKRLFNSLNENADRASEVGNQIATEANERITEQSRRSIDMLRRIHTTPELNAMVNNAAQRLHDGETKSAVVRDLKRELSNYDREQSRDGQDRQAFRETQGREQDDSARPERGSGEQVPSPDARRADSPEQPAPEQDALSPEQQQDSSESETAPDGQDDMFGRNEPEQEAASRGQPKESAPAAKTQNRVFTKEAADEARKRLIARLSQANAGIDPAMYRDGIILAGYHIESGARSFAAFAKAITKDMASVAKEVRPYLKQWYMGVMTEPGIDGEVVSEMTPADQVIAADVDAILSEQADTEAFAGQGETSAENLGDSLYSQIDGITDNRKLKAAIAEHYGVSPSSVTSEQMKVAQEAFEYALVKKARDIVDEGGSDAEIYSRLVDLYKNQPNLNVRSSGSMQRQAYSTPAPLAFVSSRLAGIDEGATVYEPTAGNGMLVIGAPADNITANEIDATRAGYLAQMGIDVTQNDATTFVPEARVDSVIMNPPFGRLKGKDGRAAPVKVDGYTIKAIDHLITAKALEAMKDDGKATIIIGANKAEGEISAADRTFFNWLYRNYNVTSHFEVSGDLYSRQGAGWPVRVITVNRRQQSNRLSPRSGEIARAQTWDQVYEQYERSLEARELGAKGTRTAVDSRQGDSDDGQVSARDSRAKQDSQDGESGKPDRPASEGDTGTGRRDSRSARAKQQDSGDGRRGDTGRERQQPDIQRRPDQQAEKSGDPKDRADDTATVGDKPGVGAKRKRVAKKASGSEYQATYQAKSSGFNDAVLVPSNMAQSLESALDSIESKVGDLDQYVIDKLGYDSIEDLHAAFMGLQVDAVAAAIYNIENNKGIIIADQTGVGKGRQAAAIIRYARRAGKTPIFMSVKPNLFSDMYGDLQDIGEFDAKPFIINQGEKVVHNEKAVVKTEGAKKHKAALQEIARTGKLPGDADVAFLTYSQIQTENLQRDVVSALKENAVFILDEAHTVAGQRESVKKNKGIVKTGAGFMFEQLEGKPVVYLSATYAKRPDNMPIYYRTDLSQAVDSIDDISEAVAQGGVPLQTVISSMLAQSGQLFRRERSFKGIEIRTEVDVENTEAHERLSDQVAEGLRAIKSADDAFHSVAMEEIAKREEYAGGSATGAGNRAGNVDHQNFSSVIHNYISQLLLGLKAKRAADQAIELHKKGIKPVLALENTMGAFLKEYADGAGLSVGDDVDASYVDVLLRALERSRRYSVTDATGERHPVQVEMSDLDSQTRAKYQEAERIIRGLNVEGVPLSPIDYMRNRMEEAGIRTKELTGRDYRIDYSNGGSVLAKRDAEEQKNPRGTVDDFNAGRIDAIILNVSGSTGLSIHASEKFKDQKPRHMTVVQAPRDINILMQMLGRINRTGQVKLPTFTMLGVNIPAEKRPLAVTSKKMKSLNANTSANDKSDTSVDAPDILNKYGDQVVAQYLSDNPGLARDLDITIASDADGDAKSEDGLAMKFTGRLARLPVDVQRRAYDDIETGYSDLMEYLNKTGQNDLEARTLDLDARIIESKIVYEGKDPSTIFGNHTTMHKVDAKYQGKPPTADDVKKALAKATKDKSPNEISKDLTEALSRISTPREMIDKAERDVEEATRIASKAVSHEGFGSMTIHEAARQADQQGKKEAAKTLAAIADRLDSQLAQRDRLKETLAQTKRQTERAINHEFQVGNRVRLDLKEEVVTGVVVGVRVADKKVSGNPYALSKTRVTFMVNSGIRNITLPLSKLQPESEIFIETLKTKGEDGLEGIFRTDLGGDMRETRFVATGNLIAGLVAVDGGRIVAFTDNQGKTHQGILMPKKYDDEKFRDAGHGEAIALREKHIIAPFLRGNRDQVKQSGGLTDAKQVVRLLPKADGWSITVPRANKDQTARTVKFDRALQKAMGSEFYGSGKTMEATFPDSSLGRVIDALANITPLYAQPSLRQSWVSAGGRDKPEATRSFDDAPDGETKTQEEGAVYSGYERDTGNLQSGQRRDGRVSEPQTGAVQGELFSAEGSPIAQSRARSQSKDTFSVNYKQVEVSTIPTGLTRVTSPQDAAHILQPLRKAAQETFVALVTDADGNVLNAIRHTIGLKDSASVDPLTVAGAIAATDGAAKVWFSHNHPSGSTTPSAADISITQRLETALDGMGVEFQGHIIVAHGAEPVFFGSVGMPARQITPTPARRDKKTSLTERVVRRNPRKTQATISDAESAKSAIRRMESESGILLLDNQYNPLGVINMTPTEMRRLRDDGRVARILGAIDKTNAMAAIIFAKKDDGNAALAAKNVATFLKKAGMDRVLDGIIAGRSMASEGETLGSPTGVFFSRSESGRSIATNELATDPAMRTDQVRDIVRELQQQFKGAPRVNVAASSADQNLPTQIREAIGASQSHGQIEGAFWEENGEVYIIAERMTNRADVERTFLHEVVGHAGIRSLMGEGTNKVLRDVYMAYGKKGAEPIIRRYFTEVGRTFDHNNPDHRQEVGDELVAHMAQTGKNPSLWKRLVAEIRKALRKMGFTLPLNDADVRDIVRRARLAVENNGLDIAPIRRPVDAQASSFVDHGNIPSDGVDGVRFSFAGARADTADQNQLATAQQRIDAGDAADTVRKETGWFKGADGKWRFEIDDSNARYLPHANGTAGKLWTENLGRVIDHTRLFAAYPQLMDMEVISARGMKASGMYVPSENQIWIDADRPAASQFSTLMHEIQHGIQSIEGFAVGGTAQSEGNKLKSGPTGAQAMVLPALVERLTGKKVNFEPSMLQSDDPGQMVEDWMDMAREVFDDAIGEDSADWLAEQGITVDPRAEVAAALEAAADVSRGAMEAMIESGAEERYRSLAGEVEARNVQARQTMSEAERAEASPESTQDTPTSEVTVVFNGKEMASAPDPANASKGDSDVRFSRAPATEQTTPLSDQTSLQRKNNLIRRIAKQPIDAMFRATFDVTGQVDSMGRWKAGVWLTDKGADALVNWRPFEGTQFQWMDTAMETARAGLIDRHRLPEGVRNLEMQKNAKIRKMHLEAVEFLNTLKNANVGASEAKIINAILTGEKVDNAEMQALAAPIRNAIIDMGEEAVSLGLISPEAFERNKGAYLHRTYWKHEEDRGIVKVVDNFAKGRRQKILGNATKGRGMEMNITNAELRRADPEWWKRKMQKGKADTSVIGQKFHVFVRHADAEGTETAPGIEEGGPRKRRVLERHFVPADQPVPAKYEAWDNRGTWEARTTKGDKVVLWRDFTKDERRKMGEILDARYNIARTYHEMAGDLANGQFFADIAKNPEWFSTQRPDAPDDKIVDSLAARKWWQSNNTFAGLEWVQVPNTQVQKSKAKRWGALAGGYVRAEIWRNLNELDRMQSHGMWNSVLTSWKLMKTARSPVVHMNNVMSNLMLMDMADVSAFDLVDAVFEIARKGQDYQEAAMYGAFGGTFVNAELRRDVLEPILREIKKDDLTKYDGMGATLRVLNKVLGGIKRADETMVQAYQWEDELFRMATYLSLRKRGMAPADAGREALEQFLNYDIRAPWVNSLRRSVLPFISYTYRAVPVVAKSMIHRPWKMAKYATIAHLANAFSYMLVSGDEDEERRVMRDELQGSTIIPGIPRMMRMPWRDPHGNPVFLDIRRWIPAGDVFDTHQGQSALGIPAPLQFGGPIMIAAEFWLNKQAFTGGDIVNELTDTKGEKRAKVAAFLYRSYMPSSVYIPGSHYWRQMAGASRGETDPMGRERSIMQVAASSFGVKLHGHDVDEQITWRMLALNAEYNELRAQEDALWRRLDHNQITRAQYEKDVEVIYQKMDRLADRADYLEGRD